MQAADELEAGKAIADELGTIIAEQTRRNRELVAALREAVDELTTCERMISGETYNNPKFNRLLGIDAETATQTE